MPLPVLFMNYDSIMSLLKTNMFCLHFSCCIKMTICSWRSMKCSRIFPFGILVIVLILVIKNEPTKWTPQMSGMEKDLGHLSTQKQLFLKHSHNRVPSSADIITTQYSHYVNGIKAGPENMYITEPGYVSRLKPPYFNDVTNSLWQFSTYMSAGELARRYNAQYIIDLACGIGYKLSAFQKEFKLICIDYKENLKIVQRNYPFIDTIEVNLDDESKCQLNISQQILSQSVVISADVIEHLADPLRCYIKVLKVSQECDTFWISLN